MSWSDSLPYNKAITIHLDSSGVIGFSIKDNEVVSLIEKCSPAIIEALAFAIKEYPEIAIVNNLLDWTFRYYVGDQLRYADESELERIKVNLEAFICSKYSSDDQKDEALGWLTQVIDKLEARKQTKAKKQKAIVRDKQGYIYLVRAETGHYKIGRTRNLTERLNLFGVKLPFKIELINSIYVSDVHFFENWLHQFFHKCRANGEWFNFDEIQVEILANLEDQSDLEDFIQSVSQ